jgi:hypothetical protein
VPAARAAEYLVELCADAACTELLEAVTTTEVAAQPTVALPQNSVVFWRVTAINGDFSARSLTWEFFVGQRSAPFDTSWLGAPDFNRDGRADVALGSAANQAYTMINGPDGLPEASPSQVLTGADGFGQRTANAGDVNRDGYADVIVGGYNGNVVYVYHGSASGLQTTPATTFDALPAGGYANSVATAGDANGDGYADVVFAPSQCSGFDVFVYPGSASGIVNTTPLRAWATPADSSCFGNIAR